MATREDPAADARRLVRTALAELLADLRRTRIALGLSQERVARAAGMTRTAFVRFELDQLHTVDPADIAAVSAVLGLDLRLNAYPAGDPLRDSVSVRLLDALRGHLHPSMGWRTEVPLPGAGERRAWDALVIARDGWAGIECISRFGAAEATLRRANLKHADDPRVARVVLLVNDTVRNRQALRSALASVRGDYPLQTREILGPLREGRLPAANGVALLRPRPQAVHSGGKLVDGRAPPGPNFVDKPVGRGGPPP